MEVDSNQTNYKCGKIQCSCIPGRFLCGEDGSVSAYLSLCIRVMLKDSADIEDFLSEEVKGPGSFSCVSGKGCVFEEPAMNQLINDIFGDKSITLDCESGECLHRSQVPGYSPPQMKDNSLLVGLSAALAAAVVVLACLRKSYG